jgi:hypothetical protein
MGGKEARAPVSRAIRIILISIMKSIYYTDGLISDRRTLTKLCILFDSVSTFYLAPFYFLDPLQDRWQSEKKLPFFTTSPCEKDLITSQHLQAHKQWIIDNRELIDEGVLNPIVVKQTPPDWEGFESEEKELMKNGKGIAYGLWGQSNGIVPRNRIYIDSPWFSIHRWQSMAGSLYFGIYNKMIPISDNENLSKLAIEAVQRFAPRKYMPTLDDISAKVAFDSISLLIPNFPALETGEILEVRDKISDDLVYFRNEIKNMINEIDEISYEKIDSIVLQRIKPQFDNLKLKINSGELFRKIAGAFFVGGTATTLLTHFLSLPLEAQIAASASFAGKILLDVHENISRRSNLRKESKNRWLVLLLKMEKLKS